MGWFGEILLGGQSGTHVVLRYEGDADRYQNYAEGRAGDRVVPVALIRRDGDRNSPTAARTAVQATAALSAIARLSRD